MRPSRVEELLATRVMDDIIVHTLIESRKKANLYAQAAPLPALPRATSVRRRPATPPDRLHYCRHHAAAILRPSKARRCTAVTVYNNSRWSAVGYSTPVMPIFRKRGKKRSGMRAHSLLMRRRCAICIDRQVDGHVFAMRRHLRGFAVLLIGFFYNQRFMLLPPFQLQL